MNAEQDAGPRVLALCGDLVVVFGMERMTFEILGVLRGSGAEVHCILNEWENHRIQPLAESIGASWSEGHYEYALRRTRNPFRWLSFMWHIGRTSLDLLRTHRRFRPTHVFVPEFIAVLKNAPALALLRARGVPVILRLPIAPARGRFYHFLWKHVLGPFATTVVAQSEFTYRRCLESGIPSYKAELIKNAIPRRANAPDTNRAIIELAASRRTLLCVGQIAPFKGTHIAVEAALTLLDRGEDLQLVVAGAEPEWPPERVQYYRRLRENVDARGHGARVHFVGNVANVLALMEASYLLVAPILQEESFGLVMLEAKSSGLPVVAFSRGAIPELVAHGRTGYLCDGLDEDSLIEGIDFFLSDPGARELASEASRRSFRDASNESSQERFAEAWRALFGSRPRPAA